MDSELCGVGMEAKMLAPLKDVDGRCCRTESISEPRSNFSPSVSAVISVCSPPRGDESRPAIL